MFLCFLSQLSILDFFHHLLKVRCQLPSKRPHVFFSSSDGHFISVTKKRSPSPYQILLGFQNTPGAITSARSSPLVSPTGHIPQTPSSSGSWERIPSTSSSWTLTPWTWKTTAKMTLSKSTTPCCPSRAASWRSEFVFQLACCLCNRPVLITIWKKLKVKLFYFCKTQCNWKTFWCFNFYKRRNSLKAGLGTPPSVNQTCTFRLMLSVLSVSG